MNLAVFLDEKISKYADRIALRYNFDEMSYAELADKINRLAGSLKNAGVKKGDMVHVYLPNLPETLISFFAIHKIGAIAGPINTWFKSEELMYLLSDSRAKALIIDSQYIPTFEKIEASLPALELVIENGELSKAGRPLLADWIENGPQDKMEIEATGNDPAFIFYTSGTTGDPKGVLLSHKGVIADAMQVNQRLELEGQPLTALVLLPLFHSYAMLSCICGIAFGHTIALCKRFSATEFWADVEGYEANYFSAVPAIYNILLSNPKPVEEDYSSLMFGICGSAPMPNSVLKQFESRFDIPIIEGYGLTEATCVSTLNPRRGVRKSGSIGLPLEGQKVFIIDESGQPVPLGVRGEIVVKGEPVMIGYHNRPEETKHALRDGVLHTGDVGYMDEDGYIFIVDRIKEMVIRGGENIYPKEIDNLLVHHPRILDAATVGIPDDMKGEEVKSYVILEPGASMTEQEVIDYCKSHLAYFKVPKYVQILHEDFPRNALGKVLKREIKKWGASGPKNIGAPLLEPADVIATLPKRMPIEDPEISGKIGFNILGTGGGRWTLTVENAEVKLHKGLAADALAVIHVSSEDYVELELGHMTWDEAVQAHILKVTGDAAKAKLCTSRSFITILSRLRPSKSYLSHYRIDFYRKKLGMFPVKSFMRSAASKRAIGLWMLVRAK